MAWRSGFDVDICVGDDGKPYLYFPGSSTDGIYVVPLDPADLSRFASAPKGDGTAILLAGERREDGRFEPCPWLTASPVLRFETCSGRRRRLRGHQAYGDYEETGWKYVFRGAKTQWRNLILRIPLAASSTRR
jgi:hypothetical protein